MKTIRNTFIIIATAIAFGTYLTSILKKAGLSEIFDFDLNEDIDHENFQNLYLVHTQHTGDILYIDDIGYYLSIE